MTSCENMSCVASEEHLDNRKHPIARRGTGVRKTHVIHSPTLPGGFLEKEAWGFVKEGNSSVFINYWKSHCQRKPFHGLEEEGEGGDGM